MTTPDLPSSPGRDVGKPAAQRSHGITESIQSRLRDSAKKAGEDFNHTMAVYGVDRLLFRVQRTDIGKQAGFVLKGGFLVRQWVPEGMRRTTMDADLTTPGTISQDRVAEIFKKSASVQCPEDGIVFDKNSVHVEKIRGIEGDGQRIITRGKIANVPVTARVDIGFGDQPNPPPARTVIRPILNSLEPLQMDGYAPATTLAEKYQTAIRRGVANSRFKDYYDLAILPKAMDFNGRDVASAISSTFVNRQTHLPKSRPDSLSADFLDDPTNKSHWQAFVKRNPNALAMTLREAGDAAWSFLSEPCQAILVGAEFSRTWNHQRGRWM